MAELSNCQRCDEVFVKTTRDICPNCYKEEEAAFQVVYKFLNIRKNRQATILEIIDKTGVEEELILKFIKEKRLRTSDFPSLAYPCEKCGTSIVEGKLCEECTNELKKELEYHEDISEKQAQMRELEKTKSVYYSIDKK